MLTLGQLEMFAQNIGIIIAAIVLIGVGGVAAIAVWTGIRAGSSVIDQRRSWAAYLADRCRADGAPYPPFIEGTCGQCGRGDTKIYHPETGEHLCPPCYETFWRNARETPVDGDQVDGEQVDGEQVPGEQVDGEQVPAEPASPN